MPGGLARVAFSFTAGMLIWRIIGSRPRKPTIWYLLPPIVLLAVLLTPIPSAFQLAYGFVSIFVIMPALVTMGALFAAPRSASAGCEFLGDISYPLYIVHRPLLVFGGAATALGIDGLIWMPMMVLCLVILAWIFALKVDPILRYWLRYVLIRTED